MLGKTGFVETVAADAAFRGTAQHASVRRLLGEKSKEMRCGMHPAASHSGWNCRALARYWEMDEWHARCVSEDALVGAAGLPQELVG